MIIDKIKILNKFKNLKEKRKLLSLKNNGIVIGTEVDEENKLYYVIERNGELFLERAKNQKISEIVWRQDSTKVTIPFKKN